MVCAFVMYGIGCGFVEFHFHHQYMCVITVSLLEVTRITLNRLKYVGKTQKALAIEKNAKIMILNIYENILVSSIISIKTCTHFILFNISN